MQLLVSRFYKGLVLALETGTSVSSSAEGREKNRSVYLHRRKRRTGQEQDVHAPPEDHSQDSGAEEDTENSLDIFAEILT